MRKPATRIFSANGARIKVDSEGNVKVLAAGNVEVHARGLVEAHTVYPVKHIVPDMKAKFNLKVRSGDMMGDGTVFVYGNPDKDEALYTRPEDEPEKMSWAHARRYAGLCEAHGHNDWRIIEDKKEADILINARNSGRLIGTFKMANVHPGDRYITNQEDSIDQTSILAPFAETNGSGYIPKDRKGTVRLVRTDKFPRIIPGKPEIG